jgi:glycerol 3-phosphatase-1
VFKTIDPANANWDYVRRMEGEVPLLFGADAEEIPGARQLLSTLDLLNLKWAIITSGTRPLVEGWLKVLKLLEPEHMVTAEDVSHGKPDPEPYQQGLCKLGLEATPNSVLVLEDAPAGVRAGKAAGCKVLGLATTHRAQDLLDAGADWVVPDLRSVNLVKSASADASFEVNLSNVTN